ncbi:hypothetical protein P4H39_25255 [Paenibacillus lautus]|uniref:hypothetical protein n=1 Tax=Paenibacillus lautus TaxID=1401 RepID=UPI002DB5D62B|nr:hypothetical protein [Paenibacillus lautus]MEC0205922.1 hypothetical protein [Paenibacillus lautus]
MLRSYVNEMTEAIYISKLIRHMEGKRLTKQTFMYEPSGEDGIVLKKRQRSPLKPGNHHDSNSSFLVLTAIVRTIRQRSGHGFHSFIISNN